MLDIRNCSIKPYCFQDGEKVIETNNPTEGFYESLVKGRSSREETLKIVEEVVDYMLKEPDKHYLNELSFDIKLVLMQDYLKYHTEQLGTRFPHTVPTK